jgi:hypothetical protein
MNSFQYAIAKAAWEAFHRRAETDFDNLEDKAQRAWLAAAQAVLDSAQKYASGCQQ